MNEMIHKKTRVLLDAFRGFTNIICEPRKREKVGIKRVLIRMYYFGPPATYRLSFITISEVSYKSNNHPFKYSFSQNFRT